MKRIMIAIGIALLMATTGYPQICDPPGEFVGITEYPIQSSGSSNSRIAYDAMEGVHITWMRGPSGFERNVYYNFRGNEGWLGETIVSQVDGAGYPTLALTSDYRANITYHNMMNNYVLLAIDQVRGFGIFNYYDPPDLAPSRNRAFWPQIALSANDDIHILMAEHTQEYGIYPSVIYSRSTDDGESWTDPIEVASVALLNGIITSASDGRVAIVYLQPVTSGEFSQVKNEICYFISADGSEWDFSEPAYITDYENDGLDIYCPWGIDAVFGPDGGLNVIWLTGNIDEEGLFIDDATKLWHYSDETGNSMQISEMSDPDLRCELAAVTSQISMPTISINLAWPSEIMSVTYVGYDDTDVSSEGNCVGDLYMVFKLYTWQDWVGPFNITETSSPDCEPGDCLSENFPSTAESIADSVHLTYVMQKLGDIPDTVYYLPVHVSSGLPVYEDGNVPTAFELYGNYPNPFNAGTTIEFKIEENGYANLTIYDITGAKVATLVNGEMEAGLHSVNWDSGDAASGVYYYSLEANGEESTRKMTLLR